MLRLLFVVVVVLLTLAGAGSFALYHFYGWKGLLALPIVIIAGLWIGKLVIGKIFKRFALGLFAMKSAALRGAKLEVHSITAVSKPEPAMESSDEPEASDDTESSDESDPDDDVEPDKSDDAGEGPRQYYAIDMTIQPVDGERIWEPGELMLTSKAASDLEELSECQVGDAMEVRIWDGEKFGADEGGKYPGQQRLRITFAVVPGNSSVWLHYYNESLGSVKLPAWDVAAMRE